MGELRENIGSPKHALRLFRQKGGGEEMKRAEENRRRDLLTGRVRVPPGNEEILARHVEPSGVA